MASAQASTLDERLKQRAGLTARVVDDEMVVLDLASGQVHHLNHTAAFIWSQFGGRASVAEVAETVRQLYEVDPSVALRDVSEVADRLKNVGLLVDETTAR